MHWQIVPTPQGCQLLVDGAPIGSPAEPPPSGWLQRMFGFSMPLAYEVARRRCRGYAGKRAYPCYMVSRAEYPHQHAEVWEEISCEEHGLPPGTCMNNLGCIPMPMVCTTREPLHLPMECPEDWLELHESDCCGEVVGCLPPDRECEKVWTYQAEACPPGYRHEGWHWAEDGEDLARVCCREPRAVAGASWLWHCIDKCFDYCGRRFESPAAVKHCRSVCERLCGGLLAPSRPKSKARVVAGAKRCPKREDYLPYCDPCTQPLCGCTIPAGCPPMDCSGPPPIPVDPHARVDAVRRGYEQQRAWQEAGGEGIVPEWFVEQLEGRA